MIKVVVHRGFSGRYPENTLPAFERAVELGVDEIEFDVKRTRDGCIVLLHDETVDRTSDGKGAVAELTLDEVKRLDAGAWFGAAHRGARIPTLEEALDVIPEFVGMNIHVHGGREDLCVREVLDILSSNSRKNAYLAIHFRHVPLARGIRPDIPICNTGCQEDPLKYIECTRQWRCQRLQFYTPAYELTRELVLEARSHGISINVFFANTEDVMERFIRLGVDAILTDFPDRLLRVRESFG